ncbi:unnamed protein product [Closterium sp. Naga37s-1]|nr:unnamed protein product [Closterium sp. Naga37s-1]
MSTKTQQNVEHQAVIRGASVGGSEGERNQVRDERSRWGIGGAGGERRSRWGTDGAGEGQAEQVGDRRSRWGAEQVGGGAVGGEAEQVGERGLGDAVTRAPCTPSRIASFLVTHYHPPSPITTHDYPPRPPVKPQPAGRVVGERVKGLLRILKSSINMAGESGHERSFEAPQKPNLLDVLRERGLADAVTSEAFREAAEHPLKIYVGFDPTAESLHLGNLLGIIALAWAQRCGHTAVALLGGATARVGDPSGKSVERPVMDEETIARNSSGIYKVLQDILSRPENQGSVPGGKLELVNNYEWWKGVSLLEFLRDVGKHARVGAMMGKESVKKRLASEEGISYTEFTYQLLQGYDFVHLYKEKGITVQMGGSDQWGNITAGTDLLRRLQAAGVVPSRAPTGGEGQHAEQQQAHEEQKGQQEEGKQAQEQQEQGERGPSVFGLTWPLLLRSDGSKFGKSEGGAIWLSAAMLSPYKFYQYLFATPDADVIKFLRMLTFLPVAEIDQWEAAMCQPGYEPNAAQKLLAQEVTRFVHGQEGLQEALRATQALAPGSTSTRLDPATLEAIAADAPSTSLPWADVIGRTVADVAAASKLVGSKGAARRLVQQGGMYLNNEKVGEGERVVGEEDLVGGNMLLLGSGKKNKLIVRVER